MVKASGMGQIVISIAGTVFIASELVAILGRVSLLGIRATK